MKTDNPSGTRAQPIGSPETGLSASERRVVAWIGKSVRIEGKVISEEDLTIDGHVDGSIELGNHSLSIGPAAAISADLFAKNITISGTVKGNVRALERIDLEATGSVEGDVTSPRLKMAEGAVVAGKVDVAGNPRT
jgi:cytoskeletal protein CcmA (bactofilin family)